MIQKVYSIYKTNGLPLQTLKQVQRCDYVQSFSISDTVYNILFLENIQSINKVFSVSTKLLFNFLKAKSGTLWLKYNNKLNCVMTFSKEMGSMLNDSIDHNAGLAGLVNENGKLLYVKDVCSDHDAIYKDLFMEHHLKGYLGCPIFIDKKIIGVLSFYFSDTNEFNEYNSSLMHCFCNFLGLAMVNCAKDNSQIDQWNNSFYLLTNMELKSSTHNIDSNSNKFFYTWHLDKDLPKNIHYQTLSKIVNTLNSLPMYATSHQIADRLSISISTIRRYLNYLESTGG